MAKGKKKNDADDDGIIEAEIIEESPPTAEEPGPATTQASVSTSDIPKAKNTAARIGWGIALLLIAFIGGIFMEPLAEQGLKRLGLVKDQTSQDLPIVDITPLSQAQEAQQAQLSEIEAAFTTQAEYLSQLKSENESLKRDMATLAAGMPTGNGAPVPNIAVEELQQQIRIIEAKLLEVQSIGLKDQTDSSVVTRLEGELNLARAESAQLLERLTAFEKSFEISQSSNLSASAEGRTAVTLHRLYLNATAGDSFATDIAALKPELTNLPLTDLQPVRKALSTLEANQSGIATHSEIQRAFNALIPELMKASVKAESTGWLANFFTLRRTDANAEGVEAVIRSIEIALANRDLASASKAADSLPEETRELSQSWQESLMARQDTLAALTDLLTIVAGDAP